MFNRKQNEIDRLNARCDELAEMLKEKGQELKISKNNNYLIMKENAKVRTENADLRCENDDLRDVLRQINKLMTCNTYNNETALRNKIIELTSDYQSIS